MGQLGAIVMVIRECLLARGGPLHTRADNEHSRSFSLSRSAEKAPTNRAFFLLKVPSCALIIKNLLGHCTKHGEYTVKLGHCKTSRSFVDGSGAQWSQARGHILGSIRNKSAVMGYCTQG